ncbi:MAG: 3-deoxy-manno-octulosonate cytidylyltransferase [Chromatiales bacterium]|nr:3-deoxy-manno-octulosonate cytidylyltransferase [Chromatiales bacterium]
MNTIKNATNLPNFKVVIPARYASQRFPGKPLYRILGKPLIQYTYENAARSGADEVIVASDDYRIIDCVRGFGGIACVTSVAHKTGSDRSAEVADIKQWDDNQIVVNLQSDEPLLSPQDIRTAVQCLVSHPSVDIATLATEVAAEELASDNVVSVVCDNECFALYFSRAVLPVGAKMGLQHIGIYVYYCSYLKHFASLAQPHIEQSESLEQLRVLWYGGTIKVEKVSSFAHVAVDTEADVVKLEKMLTSHSSTSSE